MKDLGEGANMNGLTGSGKGFDAGIRIGTAGVGKDDIRSYEFNLSSSTRALTLEDFANVEFGVRLTSVGTLGGSRSGSSKVIESTSSAINAIDDSSGVVVENNSASGNLFGNDTGATSNTNSVTSWSGGAVGSAMALVTNDAGALAVGSVTLGSNGQWTVAVNGTGAEAGDYSTGASTFTVVINGANDGPVALNDVRAAINEGGVIVGASVTANDSDVDRLDTHVWALTANSFVDANGNAAPGSLVFNADGTWSYDAGNAYNALNDGESVNLSFEYSMTDNHGASSSAIVNFTVNGQGSAVLPPVQPPVVTPGRNDFKSWGQDISHFTLVFEDTAGDVKPRGGDGYYTVKMDFDPKVRDLDLIIEDLLAALVAQNQFIDADTDLLGVVIKGGQQITSYYAYGGYNSNGETADALPAGLGFTLNGTKDGEQRSNAIDLSYSGFIY